MEIRPATTAELPYIVRMLADDPLGAQRERFEDPLPPAYPKAFDAIARQHGNEVLIAVEPKPDPTGGDQVVGCLQLTIIPGLARLGTTRAQIDSVRVDARHRGQGIGEALVHCAIDLARGRLRPGPTHHRQVAVRCPPLLRTPRIHRQPRGH